MTAELLITLLFLVIVLIAILYVISIWVYKRAPANMGFIRTGYLGTKVCLGRGAMVLPVFHEVTWVSLETLKLIVSRSRDQAVLTSDKIRIDVVAELYAHVGRSEEDLLAAARSLGERTFDTEKVRNLLEAKIVSALRSYAATKTLSELHENRDAFAKAVQTSVVESFHANGLTLEEVTIVTLEQSAKEFFDKDNVFDAEGLKVITAITSDARRQVHNTEKRTTVSIRQRELDTQLELLEIEKQEAFARAHQDREVANEQAQQIGSKQMYVLDQRMAVEQKEIDNEQALERLRAERDVSATEESRRREAAEIRKTLELEKARRDREIELVAKTEEGAARQHPAQARGGARGARPPHRAGDEGGGGGAGRDRPRARPRTGREGQGDRAHRQGAGARSGGHRPHHRGDGARGGGSRRTAPVLGGDRALGPPAQPGDPPRDAGDRQGRGIRPDATGTGGRQRAGAGAERAAALHPGAALAGRAGGDRQGPGPGSRTDPEGGRDHRGDPPARSGGDPAWVGARDRGAGPRHRAGREGGRAGAGRGAAAPRGGGRGARARDRSHGQGRGGRAGPGEEGAGGGGRGARARDRPHGQGRGGRAGPGEEGAGGGGRGARARDRPHREGAGARAGGHPALPRPRAGGAGPSDRAGREDPRAGAGRGPPPGD